jgi:N-acetylglutamate synthase/N-acetylornithine aminotransferase
LVSKSCALKFDLDGTTVTLGGIAKGSGMIHPNLATMLGLLTCDAHVDPNVWSGMLKRAISRSFNAVCVLMWCAWEVSHYACACIEASEVKVTSIHLPHCSV